MIRVMLADDDRLLGQCLSWLIEGQEDMTFLGICRDEATVVRRLEQAGADVVIIDPSAFGPRGYEVIREVTEGWPDVCVVVLTRVAHEAHRQEAIRSGARTYLTKDVDTGQVIETIRGVGRGETVRASHLPSHNTHVAAPHRGATAGLSCREQDVIDCLVRGQTNREIAGELGLTEKTVKNYVSIVLSKLEVRDRTQAAVRCMQMGLVSESALPPLLSGAGV